MIRTLLNLKNRAVSLYTKEIWQSTHMGEKSPRGWAYAFLRVISITITGTLATRSFARAAALSFTTLLSLGPLIALAVMVAGFVLKDQDPDMIANKLNDAIKFVAPQVDHYEEINQQSRRNGRARNSSTERPRPQTQSPAPSTTVTTAEKAPAEPTQPKATQRKVRPEIVRLINNFITNARSGTIGGISAITLITIVIFLFGAIEDVFNDIWGVRRTRSWLTRVVFYWTILTLGTIIFSVAITTLSAATFENFFREKIPFGTQMIAAANFVMPVAIAVLALGALTLFYRFIPNTRVFWRAALAGAVTMSALLVGNNLIAFAYFRRIEITQSLYGSLGIVPVLMLGLYVFWMIVLIGGQVSYAVQNVHFRNSQIAWGTLSFTRRERLTLIVLLTIARRFQACMPPCTVSQLGDTIKAPAQILNECLNRLKDLGLISAVPPPAKREAASDYLYQPARPLNRITLGEFKELFENIGEDPSGMLLDSIDPVSAQYHAAIKAINREPVFTKTLEQLFAENPIDGTHPPFAFGEKLKPAQGGTT
ncbi:membrane protein [Ereboglobus sp. PH5-5]|uniref:YhjD/YihY/BrkB family envelope integrity protein n=1 Tax=Ereboglobus sp. PH5-5 TaxID=2940529 RepID=UPI002404BF12|nr:YhjD/YihY/BrkB family envelope integrity protein [Ereboglobus sp. PH5-5]MDF9833373.1 membrane protein [Ereboglobus sp. PH5-5]